MKELRHLEDIISAFTALRTKEKIWLSEEEINCTIQGLLFKPDDTKNKRMSEDVEK